jgi:hypothetical protein
MDALSVSFGLSLSLSLSLSLRPSFSARLSLSVCLYPNYKSALCTWDAKHTFLMTTNMQLWNPKTNTTESNDLTKTPETLWHSWDPSSRGLAPQIHSISPTPRSARLLYASLYRTLQMHRTVQMHKDLTERLMRQIHWDTEMWVKISEE